jgi:hypothetical protein
MRPSNFTESPVQLDDGRARMKKIMRILFISALVLFATGFALFLSGSHFLRSLSFILFFFGISCLIKAFFCYRFNRSVDKTANHLNKIQEVIRLKKENLITKEEFERRLLEISENAKKA